MKEVATDMKCCGFVKSRQVLPYDNHISLSLQQIGNTGNPPNYVQPTVGMGSQPAVVNPTPTAANPPAYTPSAQQQVTTAEFQVSSGHFAVCALPRASCIQQFTAPQEAA